MKNEVAAVVLCAGSGSRMNLDITKQRLVICGQTLISRTVSALNDSNLISSITVVAKCNEIEMIRDELQKYSKVKRIVSGGRTRAESAKIGFENIEDDSKFVLIHDGARPFVTNEMIEKIFKNALKYGASTAATVITDTVKDVDENGFVISSRDRNSMRLMQTPQIFERTLYAKALSNANVLDPKITDDNMLMELIGIKVYCTETGNKNIKITVVDDIDYAEYLINGDKDNG